MNAFEGFQFIAILELSKFQSPRYSNGMRNALILILVILLGLGCKREKAPKGIQLREEMRQLVMDISLKAKTLKSNFIILPQNGIELVSETGDTNGPPANSYLSSIDAINREDLLYYYDGEPENPRYKEMSPKAQANIEQQKLLKGAGLQTLPYSSI